jgi:hypothetical protein
MNAYAIRIWRNVKHNDKLLEHSFNDMRTVVVHARNANEAKSKVKLAEPKTNITGNLTITVSAEYIYTTDYIGTVRIEPFYVYSNDRSPISVADFKKGALV